MRTLWVKICGITTPEAIAAAVDAGADAVGFVFHEPSPRNLTVERAAELQRHVPGRVERIAVFLHPDRELVERVIAAVRPDWLQTDLEDFAALDLPQGQRRLPVIRSGAVPAALPARVLLESARSGRGELADWQQARLLSERHEVILAGGLDADNVAAAVRTVRPFGVDVSSGVESGRGVKDAQLIQRFVAAARGADAQVSTATTATV